MDVLVICGGIGSGKSEVCRIIGNAFSCGVYCADERVKELYLTHPSLLTDIEDSLGCMLRDECGRFMPGALAGIIFKDRNALETVEDLVFPVLTADFRVWAKDYENDDFVIFESATILEKPQFEGFWDKLIIVDAPVSLRVERACRRDSSTVDAVLSRIAHQPMMNLISEGKVPESVDALICNDGTLDVLRDRTMKVINELYYKNIKPKSK